MRQIVTVICCAAFATVGYNLSKVLIVDKPQNTVMASPPLSEILSPIRTEVHDTVQVPDSIAYDTVQVPYRVVKKIYLKPKTEVKDTASIVKNKTSEERPRVTPPVSDTVSTDVRSPHTNTREVRKGTPPDPLPSKPVEIHGYIWQVSETR